MNYSITSLDDIERKGNVRYLEHYLEYFDGYLGAYVWGSSQRAVKVGRLDLLCLGTGHGLRDLLASPLRVYKAAKQGNATHFLTADLAYGWWHSLLLVLLRRAKIVAMPVCTPPEIIKNTGKTYSGHHPIIERLFINLTFLLAHKILVTKNSFPDQRWVSSLWCHKKMVIADATPEEMPAPEFLQQIEAAGDSRGAFRPVTEGTPVRLVYVGRLEREKLVFDLVKVAKHLHANGLNFLLTIVGDGTEREGLEKQVSDEGLENHIRFLGFQPAERVAEILCEHDIFVSTLTGTSLKEAALAKLAIVAYAIDFIPDIYSHEQDCLLAEGHDTADLAAQTARLAQDRAFRQKIASAGYDFATKQWSAPAVKTGLEQVFGEL